MPKPIKIKVKPEIYTVTQRRYLGKGAATEKLPDEESIQGLTAFNDKESAINWIKTNGDQNKVYIIRNRKGEMINSYCFRSKGRWDVINNDNYYGGYKIGNPTHRKGYPGCSCYGCSRRVPSDKPEHPSIKDQNYEY